MSSNNDGGFVVKAHQVHQSVVARDTKTNKVDFGQ